MTQNRLKVVFSMEFCCSRARIKYVSIKIGLSKFFLVGRDGSRGGLALL